MFEQLEPSLELMIIIMIFFDDLTILNVFNNDDLKQFSNYSSVWVEFTLSKSIIINDYEERKKEADMFQSLLDKNINSDWFSGEYISKLQQLAKKSGRLIEFCYLLEHLNQKAITNLWEQSEMIYKIVFNALQQPKSRINYKGFQDLLIVIKHKLCLINKVQFEKLLHFSILNSRESYLNCLMKYRSFFYGDLSIFHIEQKNFDDNPSSKKRRIN